MQLSNYQKIVIKIGSSVIISEKNTMRKKWLKELAREIKKLQKSGVQVVLVCSGAIACACKALGRERADLDISELQAYAAYGQAILIETIKKQFKAAKLEAAQMLITSADAGNRKRYLNMRSTINNLLDLNIVPVINENDSVATEEITFGDNDGLSVQVAHLISADLLILLSDVAGLYDANPKTEANAKLLTNIKKIDDKIYALAQKDTSKYGTGGMFSKIKAADLATSAGTDVLITKGAENIFALEKNKPYSFFKGATKKLSAKKRWISHLKIAGQVAINDQAVKALKEKEISILPVGVTAFSGNFKFGDLITITNEKGKILAKGLAHLSSSELKKALGKNSQELGKKYIVIHRDNLLLTN